MVHSHGPRARLIQIVIPIPCAQNTSEFLLVSVSVSGSVNASLLDFYCNYTKLAVKSLLCSYILFVLENRISG